MTRPLDPNSPSSPRLPEPHYQASPSGLRVALVHDWLTGMRGGEKCLEVLCRRFPNAPLLTLLHAKGATSTTIERMRISTSLLQRLPGAPQYHRWLLPLMPAAIERLRIPANVDVVISFSHAVAKAIKPPVGVPHVCYCFTPMRYAWHRRADYEIPSSRILQKPLAAARRWLLDGLRDWDQRTSQQVSHFAAVSRTVAQRIQECYGRPSRVIYPPVDTTFYRPANLPRGDYYLCVSALVPYKRLDLAIEACNLLKRRLIVIGQGPEYRRLAQMAGPTVTLAGWLSNEQIRDQMRRCQALLFPGHEDFGIVPVEAQACGTPVIALGEGGATESVLPASSGRPGTGLFFPEQNVRSLCAAIEEFEAHPGWFQPQLSRHQAEQFTVERFENELLSLVHEVAGTASRATAVFPPVPAA